MLRLVRLVGWCSGVGTHDAGCVGRPRWLLLFVVFVADGVSVSRTGLWWLVMFGMADAPSGGTAFGLAMGI